jgi:hypothetical protein
MKSILIATISVLILVSNALAQDQNTTAAPSPTQTPEKVKSKFEFSWLAIDVFPVSARKSSEYSPEYKWKFGKNFSGGGFAEIGRNRPFISRHNIQFKPFAKQAPWFTVRHEFAFNKYGYVLQTGFQIETTLIPKVKKVVGKVFRSLSVSPTSRWAGKIGTFNETQIGWNTKQFKLGPTKIWSEGFERIRGGIRRDFGQWQGWVLVPKLSKHIAFGFEVESTGWHKRHTPLFGIKIFK